jgi:hypothetical protein
MMTLLAVVFADLPPPPPPPPPGGSNWIALAFGVIGCCAAIVVGLRLMRRRPAHF